MNNRVQYTLYTTGVQLSNIISYLLRFDFYNILLNPTLRGSQYPNWTRLYKSSRMVFVKTIINNYQLNCINTLRLPEASAGVPTHLCSNGGLSWSKTSLILFELGRRKVTSQACNLKIAQYGYLSSDVPLSDWLSAHIDRSGTRHCLFTVIKLSALTIEHCRLDPPSPIFYT